MAEKIVITDEAVEVVLKRVNSVLSGQKVWKDLVRSAMESALNPPQEPEPVVTCAMLQAGYNVELRMSKAVGAGDRIGLHLEELRDIYIAMYRRKDDPR